MIEPEAEELREVRIAACGCVLSADVPPIGFRFVATPTGDKRVMVFCCREHDRTSALSPSPQPTPLKVLKNKRSGRPGRAAKAPAAS